MKISVIISLILILFIFPKICRGDIETLRPNAAGDVAFCGKYPNSGEENWEDVDEATADEDITYVYDDNKRDLYNLPAHAGSGTINSVTAHIRCKEVGADSPYGWAIIKTHNTEYYDIYNPTSSYTNFSKQWTTNPNTDAAWIWTEIDALQAGVGCYDSGEIGYVRCTQVYVEVDYTPITAPTVTNSGGATSVTTNSAKLNGEVTSTGGEDPTVHICWGDDDAGIIAGNWDNDINLGAKPVGTFYLDISSLNPNTTYYYRCYATNSGGTDWADDTEDFTTSVATPTVTTQAADNIGSNGATLHGNITDIGGENCTVRGFEWDTDSGESYANTWTESGSYGIGTFNHIISSLSPGVTYYFRAKAHNSAGWAYGSELSFTTISTITVTGTNIAPSGVSPGDTEVGMLKLGLATDGGSALWTNVKVDLTGTAVDGDISSVEVWKDDGNHTWDGSGSKADTHIGSSIFSGKTATITFGSSETITTGSQDFFIVYDIAGGADPSHTAGAKLLDNTYITVSGSNEVNSSGFPIESGTSTLPVELSTFTAQFLYGVATLYWRTESEIGNIGWYVYRNKEDDFEAATRVTNDLIPGYGTTTEQHDYIYHDEELEIISGSRYWYWLESVDLGGAFHRHGAIVLTIPDIPDDHPGIETPIQYGLHQNSPNPTSIRNSSTMISFVLPNTALVEVKIYNIRGELINDLYNGTAYGDVEVKLNWNGRDENGIEQLTGIYLYGIEVNGKVNDIKRLILIR